MDSSCAVLIENSINYRSRLCFVPNCALLYIYSTCIHYVNSSRSIWTWSRLLLLNLTKFDCSHIILYILHHTLFLCIVLYYTVKHFYINKCYIMRIDSMDFFVILLYFNCESWTVSFVQGYIYIYYFLLVPFPFISSR